MNNHAVMPQETLYRLHGQGKGQGRNCRRLRNWRGHAPHNVLVQLIDDGSRMVVPHRRLRKVKSQEMNK